MKKICVSLCFAFLLNTLQAQQALETVATFGKSMPIGVSVTSTNRLFVSFPNYNGNGKYALTEVINGKTNPYPDVSWNTKGIYNSHFLRVQDVYVDSNDYLWVLDSKPASKGSIFGNSEANNEGQFKLVKINTKTDTVEKVYGFEDLDTSVSGLNDVRVDTQKELAYLSDPGQAAIVILDLKTGSSRTVLQQTPFTKADAITIMYEGIPMQDKNGKAFSSHVNGIALTKDMQYLYFKPINKETLFRIKTEDLANTSLTEAALESKVETVAKVGITHGLVADAKGNIFLTTSTNYSISYVDPDGEIHQLVKDNAILWPDSLGTGTDGYLYFSCAQLQRLPQWNNGVDKTVYPYAVYRVKLP